jgi:hypothetical protein
MQSLGSSWYSDDLAASTRYLPEGQMTQSESVSW